ncbi:hypothetical protein F4821DRAFT_227943 [Hypoxylon rubiginosum]|uniref:Uncharacterized protein n=1 Tax=Hypoxylon rubiginosum TaxID=110542 RepID=A0ACC0DDG7_9PEZI|nr:hypothetical protein F4821DRAFT_227943 [Hypoxylon rubiginosum]
MYKPIISTAALLLSLRAVQAIPDPIICEDTLDGSPPFDSRDVPCILGCGVPVAIATGSLLPGSVNETDIPYCQLNCVHDDATPAQSAAAPDCRRSCQVMNQATPENIGWCMYWCVDGYSDLVETTKCVPSLTYGDEITTTDGSWTITYRPFTTPAAWQSWYKTQTVLPRSTTVQGIVITAPPATPTPTSTTTIVSTGTGTESNQSTQETLTSASTTVVNGTESIEAESAVDTATGDQSKLSPSATGMGSRPSRGILSLMLNIIGTLMLIAS